MGCTSGVTCGPKKGDLAPSFHPKPPRQETPGRPSASARPWRAAMGARSWRHRVFFELGNDLVFRRSCGRRSSELEVRRLDKAALEMRRRVPEWYSAAAAAAEEGFAAGSPARNPRTSNIEAAKPPAAGVWLKPLDCEGSQAKTRTACTCHQKQRNSLSAAGRCD